MDPQVLLLVALALADPATSRCEQQAAAEESSSGCLLSVGDLPPGFVPGLGRDRQINIDTLMKALGQPASSTVSAPFEEHYSGVLTRAAALDYPGIRVEAAFEASSSWANAYLTSITVRDAALVFPCSLHAGLGAAEFSRALGPPTDEVDGHPAYLWQKFECRGTLVHAWHGTIALHQSNSGVVTAIKISYWGD